MNLNQVPTTIIIFLKIILIFYLRNNMSFFSLTYGININKSNKFKEDKSKLVQDETEQIAQEQHEESNTNSTFPDCTKMKQLILKQELKIKKLENSKISQKLKDKKMSIIIDNLQKCREALKEKLDLNSSLTISEINPLCSFREIRK
jgi:hypothetical protein